MSSDHPWFAVHDEMPNDPKLARVRRTTRQPKMVVVGAWATLLALSNQSPVRGVLLIHEERPLTTQEIFDEWDMDGGEGQALLDAFIDQGLVYQEQGAWFIRNWEKRQPRQDNSTERVRRYRERQKASAAATGNGKIGVTNETGVTFQGVTGETLRNGIEEEEDQELEKEGEGGGESADDLYSFERELGAIVNDATRTDVGMQPSDPDDAAMNAIWSRLLNLCDGDKDHAGGVTIVTHELVSQLEWAKPFPRNRREFEDALTNWWQPIKQALAAREWDKEATITAMVAAARSMQRRDMSPGCPRAVMQELSKHKQKGTSRESPAKPQARAGGGNGNPGGLEGIRERIRQKGAEHGRKNGTG